MALINEISLGLDTLMNNMGVYRKFDGKNCFQTHFEFIDDNTMTEESNIVVNYIQYYKNSSGLVIDELTQNKYYVIPNTQSHPLTSMWFNSLARTPITSQIGMIDAIEYTLSQLPINVPNGYILYS